MAPSSWQRTRAEHKGSLCAQGCRTGHPQELGAKHGQGTGHSKKMELLWAGRRAEAAVGTAKAEEGRQGLQKWDGNRGGSQDHSLAFAGK